MKHKREQAVTPTAKADLASPQLDELYGLEPVFESDADTQGSDALTQFVSLDCPYCGEQFSTRVDLTAGDGSYVEDCQVCCQPIEISVELASDGGLHSVLTARLD